MNTRNALVSLTKKVDSLQSDLNSFKVDCLKSNGVSDISKIKKRITALELRVYFIAGLLVAFFKFF